MRKYGNEDSILNRKLEIRTVRPDKETEQMKTTLTKTRIMILLAVFLAAPLLANLPCVTGTCTGEGSCRICGADTPGYCSIAERTAAS